MMKPTQILVLLVAVAAIPTTHADDEGSPESPVPELVCFGTFRPPTTPAGASATGAVPYVGQDDDVRIVGIAVADGGDGFASHDSFVVIGGATDAEWCRNNEARDSDPVSYWANILQAIP